MEPPAIASNHLKALDVLMEAIEKSGHKDKAQPWTCVYSISPKFSRTNWREMVRDGLRGIYNFHIHWDVMLVLPVNGLNHTKLDQ